MEPPRPTRGDGQGTDDWHGADEERTEECSFVWECRALDPMRGDACAGCHKMPPDGSPMQKCARCGTLYCSATCQKGDWKGRHRLGRCWNLADLRRRLLEDGDLRRRVYWRSCAALWFVHEVAAGDIEAIIAALREGDDTVFAPWDDWTAWDNEFKRVRGICTTGCRQTAFGIFLALLLADIGGDRRPTFATENGALGLHAMRSLLHAIQVSLKDDRRLLSRRIIARPGGLVDGVYRSEMMGLDSFPELLNWAHLQGPCAFMFWLHMGAGRHRCDGDDDDDHEVCMGIDVDVQTALDLWHRTTRRRHLPSHAFLVVVRKSRAMIVQSYFGYYSVDEWLDFGAPLEPTALLPPTADPEWRSPLLPTPKYRGELDLRPAPGRSGPFLLDLFSDLDGLATEAHPSAEAYASITGVCRDAREFAELPPFRIVCTRLDLSW